MTDASQPHARVAIFASGAGTTFQALLDHTTTQPCAWSVELLVTDREQPGVVGRATAAGIEVANIPVRDRNPAEVERDTLASLENARIDVLLLAGYLRLVPAGVVSRYAGRILNTHPALLPAFGGKGMYGRHVHEAVVRSGARVTGVTIHWVDPEYDSGRPVAQWPVPVLVDDDAASVAARVQAVERTLYPAVVDHVVTALHRDMPVPPYPFAGTTFTLTSASS